MSSSSSFAGDSTTAFALSPTYVELARDGSIAAHRGTFVFVCFNFFLFVYSVVFCFIVLYLIFCVVLVRFFAGAVQNVGCHAVSDSETNVAVRAHASPHSLPSALVSLWSLF